MDWLNLRFNLFQALDSLNVHDIYLFEADNNILTLLIVADDVEKLRPLTKMKIIDGLIERRCPEIYRNYVFCYLLHEKKEWSPEIMIKTMKQQRLALRGFRPKELA